MSTATAAPDRSRVTRPIGAMTRPPVVRVRGLNYAYGEGATRKLVLSDNQIDLYPGELVILSGPSGSGKTTLLTLIGALRKVQEGSLRVLDRELRDFNRRDLLEYRRSIGFIFQHHNLFPALTAYQSVQMVLDLHRVPSREKDARTREILGRVNLGERLHYRPAQLSGGQRQRVAIARALVHRPKLILADEPTAALDKENSRNVVELLKERARLDDATILMVTHDMRLLDAADRLVHMVDGQIQSNVRTDESLEVCELLRGSGFFQSYTPGELVEVAQRVRHEVYYDGDVVIEQGEVGDRFYVIRRGAASVEVKREGGAVERPPALGPGAYFGERALIQNEPRAATVRAAGPLEVWSLGKDDFQKALARRKPLGDELRGALQLRNAPEPAPPAAAADPEPVT